MMEKRKWLWKKKPSERSPGETENSGSMSSHSDKSSDDQDNMKVSLNNGAQSPEVTSSTVFEDGDVSEKIKCLTEKLSAALVNVSAKDDLVKQHAKVAEEAVAGWEKAENELLALKKQFETATKQNSVLEDRVTHLDGALKECVRQLRQAREEQEEKIHEALATKTREWESTKSEPEINLLVLKKESETAKLESPPRMDSALSQKLEYLEHENELLKLEVMSLSEELEVRKIERDLSAQAAESASKQHLESIKKMAKLEAECRRLRNTAGKPPSVTDHKTSAASSIYVESLTDSQSDSGERLNALELETHKISCSEPNKNDSSDSWASALIAKLDQFKNEKVVNRNLPASSIDIDSMDDFLEMERLAAMSDPENEIHQSDPETVSKQPDDDAKCMLRAELETMTQRTAQVEKELQMMEKKDAELIENLQKVEQENVELEQKLAKVNAQNADLEMALAKILEENTDLLIQLKETKSKLDELQHHLSITNESKQKIESQLISMEVDARTMSEKVNTLETEVEKERAAAAETTAKCRKLEEELTRMKQQVDIQQAAISNNEPKIKQEDLDVAAGKLAECQKTIAALGKQLKSLATLEDFLIDTSSLPGFSTGDGTLIPRTNGGAPKLHHAQTFSPKRDSVSSRVTSESSGPSNKNDDTSPLSSASSTSSNHVSSEKNRNGFAKFFSRSKNGIQIEI